MDRSASGPFEPFNPVAWQTHLRSSVLDDDRVAAVEATGLLDSPPAEAFDHLTSLAAAVLGVPLVFVTLVDAHRSFWMSAAGLPVDPATGRYGESTVEDSFCQYVIGTDAAVVIDDARVDLRSAANPAIDSMGVVAWAGFPLRSTDGHVLGTFCAVDRVARAWSAEDLTLLDALATAATSHLQLRAALAAAHRAADELRAEVEHRDLLVSRATMMAQLAQELSAVSTVDEVARVITTTGRAVLDAAFANIAVADTDHRLLRIVHSPPLPTDIADKYATIGLADHLPLADAVSRGEPVLLPDLDELGARYPAIVDDTAAAGLGSTASIPLFRADRSVAGAMGVGWRGPTAFTPFLRSVLTTVSEICAQALDRSQVGDARTQFVRSLQYALLSPIERRAGLDIAAEYVPANDTLGFGGDWYDVIDLAPTRTAVVVGDVCGHGIEAAARMTQIRGAVNALVSLHSDPLGQLFDLAEQQLGLRDNDFVATLSVHVIDTATDTITYVSAGHPPAILVGGDGEVTLLEGGRRPVLGCGPHVAETAHAPFGPGAILLAYTDGLVETERDLDVGIGQLCDLVVSARDRHVRDISSSVTALVPRDAADDIAYAIVRRASAEQTSAIHTAATVLATNADEVQQLLDDRRRA